MFLFKSRMLWEGDGAGGAGSSGGDPGSEGNTPPAENTLESWSDYLSSLPEDSKDQVQRLFDAETAGLKSALQKERENNRLNSKQLKALSEKAEQGSELREELNKLLAKTSQQELENRFYETAHQKGVTNLKLALAAALQADLISDGEVDWDGFEKQFPELFKKEPPKDKSKSGRKTETTKTESDMNDWIRSQSRK